MSINKSILFLLFFVCSNVMAYPNHDPNVYDGGNLWSITFHNDDSVTHTQWATQRICFMPYTSPTLGRTHLRGRWYSTTFPDWNGHYSQEGDSVKLVGNFWNGRGNDSIRFDIVTSGPNTSLAHRHHSLATGHWDEWQDDGFLGVVFGWGNTILERIGRCKSVNVRQSTLAARSADSSDEEDLNIKPRYLKDGSEAQYPQQEEQEEITGQNEYESLF